MIKNSIKTTDVVIIGAGFAGLYLAHILFSNKHSKLLIVAPGKRTVSDKSYYNFRSRGVKQTSLKDSMIKEGRGKCNNQLVNVFVNNIDDELTHLNYITETQPSYLGVKVVNPKALLEKLKEETKNHRLYSEVISIKKSNCNIVVETTNGIVHCKKLVFCSGGNRSRFSENFKDERVSYDMFVIAQSIGCKTELLDEIMYHPFYSKGVCIPSDNLFDFDIVDQSDKKFIEICRLLRAHNIHHCFKKVCKELKKAKKYFTVKGNRKIELDVEPHYTLGGIKINKHGQTNIKDVYALGECSFGLHGFGRLGGCSMSEIVVMARIIAGRIV